MTIVTEDHDASIAEDVTEAEGRPAGELLDLTEAPQPLWDQHWLPRWVVPLPPRVLAGCAGVLLWAACSLPLLHVQWEGMIGKLLAHGDNRDSSRARLRTALSEIVVEGIHTNITLHRHILEQPAYHEGGVDIHYLERLLRTDAEG